MACISPSSVQISQIFNPFQQGTRGGNGPAAQGYHLKSSRARENCHKVIVAVLFLGRVFMDMILYTAK